MCSPRPFQVMVKPIGPVCNLNCDYCFYLAKTELFSESRDFRLTDEILELFIQEYIQSQPGPEVAFVWQGGEPTLMGVDFFRRAIELQNRYLPPGWKATNALQTNGTLIDQQWAQFFQDAGFLIGLSLDGLQKFHDLYRRDRQGDPTWEQVVRGLRLLQEYQVQTNILCVVNRENASEPLATYQALRELGADYIQFIPLVELTTGELSAKSVSGPAYGRFLTHVFNYWLEHDLGSVFVQIFEEALSRLAGFPPSMCVFVPHCGRQLIMEHNGDFYSCDHYVEPKFRLGNIMENSLTDMVESEAQRAFGLAKGDLADECRICPVLNLCQGECPKNRHHGLNVLCAGYHQFFLYVQPFLNEIIKTLRQGNLAMQAQVRLDSLLENTWSAGRNDSCPCGSGLKYKKCCLGIR